MEHTLAVPMTILPQKDSRVDACRDMRASMVQARAATLMLAGQQTVVQVHCAWMNWHHAKGFRAIAMTVTTESLRRISLLAACHAARASLGNSPFRPVATTKTGSVPTVQPSRTQTRRFFTSAPLLSIHALPTIVCFVLMASMPFATEMAATHAWNVSCVGPVIMRLSHAAITVMQNVCSVNQ